MINEATAQRSWSKVKIVTLSALLALSACASDSSQPVALHVGESKSEVLAALHEPMSRSVVSTGAQSWESWVYMPGFGKKFIPIYGAFTDTNVLVVTFGPDGRLIRWSGATSHLWMSAFMTSIDFTEIETGERWELFAAEFLTTMGFSIDSQVGRGPDGGKDLIVSEDLPGKLARYPFRWLVSCKHFARAGNSVGVDDEKNILERVNAFHSEGFLAFYSTLPSSALATRLEQLVKAGSLKSARCLNFTEIEQILISKGLADLIHRYFPASYVRLRPAYHIFGEYIPLPCKSCGEDLLLDSENRKGRIIVFVYSKNSPNRYDDVFTVCKGDCDRDRKAFLKQRGLYTSWEDLDDLLIPAEFMRNLINYLNILREQRYQFSDESWEKLKQILRSLSQRVLREMTVTDSDRFQDLLRLPSVW
jgi:Restriction endonuclease